MATIRTDRLRELQPMITWRQAKNFSPFRQFKLAKQRRWQRQVALRAVDIIKEHTPPDGSAFFIDCGFNTRHVFDTYYEHLGARFQYHGFEIQKNLYDAAVAERKYLDAHVTFHHAAVSDKDGECYYFEPDSWGVNYKGGSSIMQEKLSRKMRIVNDVVQTIDFARFIKNTFCSDEFIVVKMDIEGAEYAVLEAMSYSGVLDMIDLLFVEFHAGALNGYNGVSWVEREQRVRSLLEASRCNYYDWI